MVVVDDSNTHSKIDSKNCEKFFSKGNSGILLHFLWILKCKLCYNVTIEVVPSNGLSSFRTRLNVNFQLTKKAARATEQMWVPIYFSCVKEILTLNHNIKLSSQEKKGDHFITLRSEFWRTTNIGKKVEFTEIYNLAHLLKMCKIVFFKENLECFQTTIINLEIFMSLAMMHLVSLIPRKEKSEWEMSSCTKFELDKNLLRLLKNNHTTLIYCSRIFDVVTMN